MMYLLWLAWSTPSTRWSSRARSRASASLPRVADQQRLALDSVCTSLSSPFERSVPPVGTIAHHETSASCGAHGATPPAGQLNDFRVHANLRQILQAVRIRRGDPLSFQTARPLELPASGMASASRQAPSRASSPAPPSSRGADITFWPTTPRPRHPVGRRTQGCRRRAPASNRWGILVS